MAENTPYRTLIDAVSFRNQSNPQGRAFVFLSEDGQAQVISNEQFYQEIKFCAMGLAAKGIRPGEVVLLALDHGFELINCFWGTICCGAVPSVMTYWRPGSDADVYARKIERLASAVRARAVITLPDLYLPITEVLAKICCQVFTFHDVTKASSGMNMILPEPRAEQTALLQFTSGTTGAPKAIQFSHRAVLEHVTASAQAYQMTKDSVYVSWLPFYHDMGLIGHIRALISGGMLVLMAPQTWLKKPEMLLQAIHRYRGTMANMPNFSFDYCTQRIHDEDLAGIDLSSWQVLSNGSEQVMPSSMQRFSECFAVYGFREEALAVGYGMAENVMGISATPPGQGLKVDWVLSEGLHSQNRAIPVEAGSPGARTIASCGYPYRGIELAILDDRGERLPEREVGEVAIQSNTLFRGYYLAPEASEETVQNGWFRTGDVGYCAAGQLYICDRKKDLIITGGRNVHPQAIENIATGVFKKFISRCAAFGLSDTRLGTEMPILLLERRVPTDDAEVKQLIRRVRQQVSDELEVSLADVRMVPKGWLIKTTSGKVARNSIRNKYLAEGYNIQIEDPMLSLDELTPQRLRQILTHLFEKVLGIRGVGRNDNFIELGGDSLSALRLLLEIEQRFGYEVSVTEFFEKPTVEHMTMILSRQTNEENTTETATPPWPHNAQQLHSRIKSQLSLFFHDWSKIKNILIWQRIAGIIYKVFLIWRWLCGRKWFQHAFNLKKVRLIQQFYASLETPVQSEKEVLQCGLICDVPKRIRKQQLKKQIYSYWPGHWTLKANMTTLERAYQRGNGVIIVGRHLRSYINRLVRETVLERLKPNGYTFIGRLQYFLPKGVKSLALEEQQRLKLTVFLNQMMKSKSVLKRGGVVLILPDGKGGLSRKITVPLHGRIHGFRTGFAELAMETNAAVIPVSLAVDVRKRQVAISFLEPFNIGSADMSQAERIEGLVMQYAAFLKQEWARCPGLVPFDRMRKHLDLPPLDRIE
ncbi:MAG: AMP-binding protein [Smithella sp.]|jgi:acyl-CoA synthetase (AMP-forming)/AMP-acid ligase II/acyl carrier protein